jgi:hypothetical protein
MDYSASSMVDDMLRWDQHRAGYIQRKLSGNVSHEDTEISDSTTTLESVNGGGAGDFSMGDDGTGGMAKVNACT